MQLITKKHKKKQIMAAHNAKNKKAAQLESISIRLQVTNQLHQRASKLYKFSGLKISDQIRAALSEYLTKQNY